MDTGKEEQIKARAYEIWEREGRPSGRAHEHWEQARRELNGDASPQQQDGKGKAARKAGRRATAPNDNPAAATPGFMPGTGSTGDVGDALSPVKRPRKSGTTRKK